MPTILYKETKENPNEVRLACRLQIDLEYNMYFTPEKGLSYNGNTIQRINLGNIVPDFTQQDQIDDFKQQIKKILVKLGATNAYGHFSS